MSDRITLRFLAAPTDATATGRSVQAGRVLEWIDKAGYACAVGWSRSYCVTAYVGNVHFSKPIRPGDLVECSARIIHTGRTSMQVLVAVSHADPKTEDDFELAMHCVLVFVAVDDAKKPREVPQWTPSDDVGRALSAGAEARIEARKEIRDLMRAQEYSSEGTTPSLAFRFLASPGDVNWGGNAHGGIVMRWIDEACDAVATGWCKGDAVAVYTGGLHFDAPVHIGDLVEIEVRLIHTGPHSMHLAARVFARNPREDDRRLTTQCMSIFVLPGADGHAVGIPQLELVSEEDRRLDAHAVELIARRKALPAFDVAALGRELVG